METESSEWQLRGQPTVLLTLAHIFHHFAPLLVRRRRGRCVCGTCLRPPGPRVLGCMRPSMLLARVLSNRSPQTLRTASWEGRAVMSQAEERKP